MLFSVTHVYMHDTCMLIYEMNIFLYIIFACVGYIYVQSDVHILCQWFEGVSVLVSWGYRVWSLCGPGEVNVCEWGR